jgi:Mg2+ and Co2+ transporter CorA
MDLQQETNQNVLPNIQVLVELLKNDENGSIPLVNFLDNTQYFLEKIQTLEYKVQELEQKLGQKTEENDDISTMRKINTYFSPENDEKEDEEDVLDTFKNEVIENEEIVQEPPMNIDNIDDLLMTNLEHMENLVQIAKNLHSK